jgi:hypothetical protein
MSILALTAQQISASLEEQEGELRLDSRIMVDGFGIKSHSDYQYQTLQKYETELSQLGSVFKTEGTSGEIVWYLNQAQVNFAGTLARNTEKAVAFKLNLVKAFEIAKKIIPVQSDRIRELELMVRLAEAESDRARAEQRLLDTRDTILKLQPQAIADRILGVTTIEKVEVRTKIVDQYDRILNAANTVTKTELAHRYGFVTKTGKPDTKLVTDLIDEAISYGAIREPWHDVRVVTSPGFDAELVPVLDRFHQANPVQRQRWMGEN